MPVSAVTRRAGVSAAALGLLLAPVVAAPTAQAAGRDGTCQSGEFCYYYNSGQAGSVSDFTTSIGDYGTSQPGCYDFKGAGAGKGVCVKNNAASVWNRTSKTVTVYYNSSYGGATQKIAAGGKANLNATLKNNNASHRIGSTGGVKAGDDYPYKGQSSGIDRWNFYKGECTSFAAWALNSRMGVTFTNQYKGASRWGNAKNWDNTARAVGVPVYSRPKAGDIAVREGGTFGHVAFVTKVNANGTFEVDEYNYGGGSRYSHRTTSVGTANSQFSSFIRFR